MSLGGSPPADGPARRRGRMTRWGRPSWITRWAGWWLVLACAVVSAASIAARARIPVLALGDAYDDALFVRLSRSLVHGDWLGTFDDLTLVKVPGYPLFVAASHAAGIPLKVSEQLTLIAAAAALATCVWLATRRRVITFLAFTAIATDAAAYSDVNAGVRRDGWYAAISLLLILVIVLASRAAVAGQTVRSGLLGVAFGVTGAAYLLAREEVIWLVPSAGLAFALPALALLWHRWRAGGLPRRWARWALGGGRLALVVVIAAACGYAPIAYIQSRNRSDYGGGVTDDAAGAFARAYGLWAGVQAGPPVRYVAISADQRAAGYAASPLAAQLRPYLENPLSVWRARSAASCPGLGICHDYVAWLESFAVRDAAQSAGHFDTEADAQSYFTALGDQLTAACADGRLHCVSGYPGLPGVRDLRPADALRRTVEGLRYTLEDPQMDIPLVSVPAGIAAVRSQAQRALADVVVGAPSTAAAAEAARRRFASVRPAYTLWNDVSRVGLQLLMITGVAGALGGLIWLRRGNAAVTGLLAVTTVALVSRAVLLGVLDATTLPGAVDRGTYEQATHLLLLTVAVLGTVQLAELARPRRTPARTSADPGRTAPPADSGVSASGPDASRHPASDAPTSVRPG